MSDRSLEDWLADALPKDHKFHVHHVSTSPYPCSAIFAPAMGQREDQTYCESHFLSVSIDHDISLLQIIGIEVLIYTTRHSTTIFVSKADSTGCLHNLKLEKGAPSPVRTIATIFLQFLVYTKSRHDRKLVLSLFARAQNQYLFPASRENIHKHILDDRSLIRWWCRVIQPILRDHTKDLTAEGDANLRATAYLRVPGYDAHGTRTFFPREISTNASQISQWIVGDPLCEIAPSTDLPERCLIPRFPDDPKARFVEDLDAEIPDQDLAEADLPSSESSIQRHNGKWRSITSLDQFWDAMSFRQECSSGRLVGFLWVVFPPEHRIDGEVTGPSTIASAQDELVAPAVHPLHHAHPVINGDNQTQHPINGAVKAGDLAKEHSSIDSSYDNIEQAPNPPSETSEFSEYYFWPIKSRGEIILSTEDYKITNDLLLNLDYANDRETAESTKKWIDSVTAKSGRESWGRIVTGRKDIVVQIAKSSTNAASAPQMLGAGLIRKKKRPAEVQTSDTVAAVEPAAQIVSMDASKKQKIVVGS